MPTITIELTDAQWEEVKKYFPKNVAGVIADPWTEEALAEVFKKRIRWAIRDQKGLEAAQQNSDDAFSEE